MFHILFYVLGGQKTRLFSDCFTDNKRHTVSIYNISLQMSGLSQNMIWNLKKYFFQSLLSHAKENLSSERLKLPTKLDCGVWCNLEQKCLLNIIFRTLLCQRHRSLSIGVCALASNCLKWWLVKIFNPLIPIYLLDAALSNL